jgi:hypothetical protein
MSEAVKPVSYILIGVHPNDLQFPITYVEGRPVQEVDASLVIPCYNEATGIHHFEDCKTVADILELAAPPEMTAPADFEDERRQQ